MYRLLRVLIEVYAYFNVQMSKKKTACDPCLLGSGLACETIKISNPYDIIVIALYISADLEHVENSKSSMIFIVSGALGVTIIILLLIMVAFAIRFSFKKCQFPRKSKYTNSSIHIIMKALVCRTLAVHCKKEKY